MKIKEGYNDKETEIRINATANGNIEFWIKQTGLPENSNRETLAYISVGELQELLKEIQTTARDLFSL